MAGMSVFVNIGAKLLPSLGTSASRVEQRFAQMNRKIKLGAAEAKAELKSMTEALKPLAAMAAAGGLSFGLKGIFGNGNQYAHELAMLKAAGRTTTEVSQAIAAANKTIRDIPTSTLTDNLKIINETTGAFGNFHHAIENLSFNSKLGYMMTNMMGIDKSEVPHALNSMVQALEVRGTAMDNEKYRSDSEALFKAMVHTRGRFNADEFKSFSQTGNLPIKLYNQRFMAGILPSLITELGGGDIVGTQAAAFRNQIMGRVALGGKKMTQEWIRLGLVPANGTPENMSKNGWTAGSAKGHALAMRDPFAWVETVLLPSFTKAGIDISNQEAVLTQVGKMFGRETSARFVSTMVDPVQRKRLHKDEKMISGALPLDKSYELMLATDPLAAIAKSQAALDNLSTRMGKLFTQDVIDALNLFARAVNKVGDAVDRNPWLGKLIVFSMGFGAIGATMRVFGVGLRWLLSPLMKLGPVLARLGGTRLFGNVVRYLTQLVGVRGLGRLALRLGPIGAALAAIGVAMGLLVTHGKAIGAFFSSFGKGISDAVSPEAIKGFKALSDWITWLVDPFAKLEPLLGDVWGWLGKFFAPGNAETWSKNGASFGRTVGGWIDWLGRFIGKLDSAITKSREFFESFSPGARQGAEAGAAKGSGVGGTVGALAGKRALGGPVWPGGTFLVGERGPELFTPGRSGTIIPAEATRNALSGRAKAGGDTYNFSINGASDPQAVAQAVRAELQKLARQQDALLND